jgi:hypothetical protein
VTGDGYRGRGEFCWLVARVPSLDAVCWVSSDYFIYTDLLSSFRIDRKSLQGLPRG